MALIVCKFGGTSVASPERIQKVAKRLIARKQAGNDVVAVVSAMGKTTDELVGLARALNPNPPVREMDRLLSTGEQVASRISVPATPSAPASEELVVRVSRLSPSPGRGRFCPMRFWMISAPMA